MHYRYRSFFWPVVLIVVGVLALLVNANLVSVDRLYRLADLWPVILVVIGLEIITRRALRGRGATSDLTAALIVLIAAGGALIYVSGGPQTPGPTHTFDGSDQIGDLTTVTLHVDVGAANLTVQGNTSMGNDLYRAHIEYAGPSPVVTLDRSTGDLHISQNGGFAFFGGRRFTLNLQISSTVLWNISINAGAATNTFNLGDVKVGAIDLNTGASREDVTFGLPSGVVFVTMSGGALTVHIQRPVGTEASVQVSGGAVNLSADGHQFRGIGNESWQSDGYDNATDAYRIEINGGASNVTLDTVAAAA